MIERQINNLIGKPYDKNGYNCWDLVQELDPHAPSIDVVARQFTAMKQLKRGLNSELLYSEVYSFEDGDIIMLGNSENNLHHAGYYYGGLLIHNRPTTGVVAQKIEEIKIEFKYIRGFRYDS